MDPLNRLFLRQRDLIDLQGEHVFLTPLGFRFYGAISALFWSNSQKKSIMNNL